MDIKTEAITLKQYTIEMSELELEHYIDEPDELIDALRRARLNGLTPAPSKGSERYQKSSRKGVIIRARQAKRRNRTSGPGIEMVTCPKCGMQVKARGLLIHQNGQKCKARQAAQALAE